MATPATSVLTVSFYSTKRLRHLFDNLLHKASEAEKLDFLVVDNTGGHDGELAEFAAGTRARTLDVDARGLQPSVAHARGLEQGLGAVTTDYVLVVDPDVHVFLRDWDTRCLEWLSNARAIALGAPYPFWKLGKYHDFPSPIFCFARADDLRALGNDWRPFHPTRLGRSYSFLARKVVRLGPLGSKQRLQRDGLLRTVTTKLERLLPLSAPDTGFRLAAKARERGAPRVLFEAACPDTLPRVGGTPFEVEEILRDLATEYEVFTFGGQLVLTHQYSSASYHWRTQRGRDVEHWHEQIRAVESAITRTPEAF